MTMSDFFNELLLNLTYVAIGAGLFLVSYLSNMSFSLYYNIKILMQEFDKNKIINSALRVASIIVGLALLCIAITTIPQFATYVGLKIPTEYIDIFSNLAILTLFITSACKYVAEAYGKFKKILETSKDLKDVVRNPIS